MKTLFYLMNVCSISEKDRLFSLKEYSFVECNIFDKAVELAEYGTLEHEAVKEDIMNIRGKRHD